MHTIASVPYLEISLEMDSVHPRSCITEKEIRERLNLQADSLGMYVCAYKLLLRNNLKVRHTINANYAGAQSVKFALLLIVYAASV